jgi:hypothetical protein
MPPIHIDELGKNLFKQMLVGRFAKGHRQVARGLFCRASIGNHPGGVLCSCYIMFLAGAFPLYQVTKLAQSASKALASRIVHASFIYLPVVLGLMIAGKRQTS